MRALPSSVRSFLSRSGLPALQHLHALLHGIAQCSEPRVAVPLQAPPQFPELIGDHHRPARHFKRRRLVAAGPEVQVKPSPSADPVTAKGVSASLANLTSAARRRS